MRSGQSSKDCWTSLRGGHRRNRIGSHGPMSERQPNVENIPEIPPTTPSEHPEVWGQQIDPSESIFEVSPDATTEEWRRTMKDEITKD